jgi:hypothetical protein
LPVEPHRILKDHPICTAGNMVLSNSQKMRTEKHKRIVITTTYKYQDDRIVNEFVEMFRAAPL